MPFDLDQRLVELAAGVYVEEDTLRIVQRVMEYDPNLRVKYLDPDRGGELNDPPYKIFELCPDGHERLVFGVWDLDERVIERLWAADTQRHDVLYRLDGTNALARQNIKRRFEEERAEALEIVQAVVRSPKDTYTMPGKESGTTVKFSATEPVKTVTRSGLEVKE